MKIHIIAGRSEAGAATGTAVLIDLFRATSTLPVMFLKGAETVVPFMKMREARRFARANENAVTVGERFGIKIPGFDFNNSPSDIYEADLSEKKVAFTTTNGTKVLGLLENATEILASSFINHSATVRALSEHKEVWIVRADRPDGMAQEDNIYAEFLKNSLEGGDVAQDDYTQRIRNCNGAKALSRLGYARDVEMALKIDMADFPVFFRNGIFVRG